MLDKTIENFCENLTALRGFVALISSALESHHKQKFAEHSDALIAVAVAIRDVMPENVWEPIPPDKVAKAERLRGEVEAVVEGEVCTLRLSSKMRTLLDKGHEAVEKAIGHHSLLYRSALISLVSAAEWLVSQLIREHIERYPDSAGIKDKTMTLGDLQALGSIEEARTLLIQSRIEEIMFGSLSDSARGDAPVPGHLLPLACRRHR